MQAVVLHKFGREGCFALEEVTLPIPKEGEVRVKIKAAAFNPVDWKIREGWYGGDPHQIIGFDFSGVIDAAGPQAKHFAIGDEVYGMALKSSNGTYAQYSCVPQELLARKPKNLNYDQTAAIPLATTTAFRATIASGAFKKGDTVFAGGIGGGVGVFAIQFLKQLGIKTIYTVARDRKSADFLVEHLGIDLNHIVLYEGLSHEELKRNLLKLNGGEYFDATLDLVGGEMKKLCLELTGYSGHFSTVLPEKDFQFPIWEENAIPRARNMSIHQVALGAELADQSRRHWQIYSDHLQLFTKMLETGSLKPPFHQIVGPLSVQTVETALQLLERGRVKGKLVMAID